MRTRADIVVLIFGCLAIAPLAKAGDSVGENKYDLLTRSLAPFLKVYSGRSSSHRAFTVKGGVVQPAGIEPNVAPFTFILQPPDKIRVHVPWRGTQIVLARDGKTAWCWPKDKIEQAIQLGESLTQAAMKGESPPEQTGPNPVLPMRLVSKKDRFEPYVLPVPSKQLALLPMLLEANEVSSEMDERVGIRVLDVQASREWTHKASARWMVRLHIRPDARYSRIIFRKVDSMVDLLVDSTDFSGNLPKSTWLPTKQEAAGALKLDAPRFQQIISDLFQWDSEEVPQKKE